MNSSLDRDIGLINTSQSDTERLDQVPHELAAQFIFHSTTTNQQMIEQIQKRKSPKIKVASILHVNDEDLDKLVSKGPKTSKDPTEEYKFESENYSIFDRQASSSEAAHIMLGGSVQQDSARSKDPYEQELMATIKKQEKQMLQNQLDVIEEEIEESMANDQKLPGLTAVIRKVEQKPGMPKEDKTVISMNQINLKAYEVQSQLQLNRLSSKAERDSIGTGQNKGLTKIGQKLSQNKQDQSDAFNSNNMMESKAYSPLKEDKKEYKEPMFERRNSNIDLRAVDSEAEIEKIQMGMMGFNHLQFGSLVTFNIDRDEKCFKMISKKQTSNKVTKYECQEEEYDSRCIFRIIPSSQYTAQQRVRDIIEHKEFSFSNIQREYDALMAEGLSNKTYQNMQMATDSKYWTEVQIVHDYSKRFLSVEHLDSHEISQYYNSKVFLDTEVKKLQLSSFPSKQTHFKIIPACNFQTDGSGLISSGHYFYIIYTDLNNKEYYLYDHQQSNSMLFTESYKTPFRFTLVRNSNNFNEPKNLGNSQVVILTSANEHKFVNAKLSGETQDIKRGDSSSLPSIRSFYPQAINLRSTRTNQQKLEAKMRLDRYEDIKGIDLYGFWIIEPDSLDNELKLRLKNFMTNQYLNVEQSGLKKQNLNLSNEATIDNKYEIVPINKTITNLNQIDSNLVFKLRTSPISIPHYQQPLYLRASRGRDQEDNFSKTIQSMVSNQFESNKRELFMRKQCQLNKDDTFKFIFPENEELEEINFCADTMQILRQIQNNLVDITELSSKQRIKFNVVLVNSLLQGLLKYCLNQVPGMTVQNSNPGAPIKYRQHILKRIGLIDFLMEYLNVIKNTNRSGVNLSIISKKDQKQWEKEVLEVFSLRRFSSEQKFETLIDLIFELIYCVVKNQPTFKNEIIGKLDILQKFVFIEEAPRVLIDLLHEELVSINKKEIHALSEPIKIFELEKYKPLLDFFIQTLQPDNRKKRYLYMLRKICIQDDRPFPLVQGYIYQKLFNDLQSKGKFFEIKEVNGQFEITDEKISISYTFQDFDNIHKDDKKTKKLFKFLLEQLDLMADLCRGRNVECQKLMKTKFKFEILMQSVLNDKIPKNGKIQTQYSLVKAKFLKLINVLYIDCEPHQEISYSRVLCYSKEESHIVDSQFFSLPNENGQLALLFNFVNAQLPQFCLDSDLNQFDTELLNLCQNLLRFGLFKIKEGDKVEQMDILHLSDFLFKLLIKSLEFLRQHKNINDIDKRLLIQMFEDNQNTAGLLLKPESQAIERELDINNPVDKSTLDIKNQLLNIRDWSQNSLKQSSTLRLNTSMSRQKLFRTNVEKSLRLTEYFNSLVTKVVEVLHQFIDIRHHYFLQNMLKLFATEVIDKLDNKEVSIEKIVSNMQKLSQTIFPKAITDHPQELDVVKFSSLQKQYLYFYNKYYNQPKDKMSESQIDIIGLNFPPTFDNLAMQIFNNMEDNQYIQQMTLSLISRCNSENGEYFRNLAKSLIILEQQDLDFFNTMRYQLNLLFQRLQKSNIWVNLKYPIQKNEFEDLYKILKKFRNMFYYEHKLVPNSKGAMTDFEIDDSTKRRGIVRLYQNMFRSLKGYDVILNYLEQNKRTFIYLMVSLNDIEHEKQWATSNETIRKNMNLMRKVYKKCFQILEAFTTKNKQNQGLMWKYKEQFIYPKLKNIAQLGELNFVKAIVYKNQKVASDRDLDQFVTKLNMRMDGESKNTAVLLDIYNSLIYFHDLPYVKKAVFIALDNNQKIRELDRKQDKVTFQTGIVVLEILSNLLQNDQNGATSEILKPHFGIQNNIKYINDVMTRIEELQKQDLFYEDQIEELKDKFLCNYCIITYFLFLSESVMEDYHYQNIMSFFRDSFVNDFMIKASKVIQKLNAGNYQQLSIPEIKYLVYYSLKYIIVPMKTIQSNQLQFSQSNNLMTHLSLNLKNRIGSTQDQFDKLDNLITQIKELLFNKYQDQTEVQNLFKFFESNQQRVEQEQLKQNIQTERSRGSMKSGKTPTGLLRRFTVSKESSYHDRVVQFEMNQIRNYNQIIKQSVVHALQDQRYKQIKGLWKQSIDYLVKNNQNQKIIIEEQMKLTKTLVQAFQKEGEEIELKRQEEIMFVYNLIKYFNVCEKAPWTLFNYIFGLNMLRSLQVELRLKCQDEINMVREDLVNFIFNNQVNYKMCINTFNVANESKQKSLSQYNKLVISRTINYLSGCDSKSIQEKLLAYFNQDKANEQMFRFVYTYLSHSIDQIKKGSLYERYQKLTDKQILSKKVYYFKEIPEVNLLNFLIMIASGQSKSLKNLLRKQPQNHRSYNIMHIVWKYFQSLLKDLSIPTFFYQVELCLEFFYEMVQDYNYENEQTLIENGLFTTAKNILSISKGSIQVQEPETQRHKYDTIGGKEFLPNPSISKLKYLVRVLIKVQTIKLLFYILESYPYSNDVYHQFRREFTADTFRLLFTEFGYFYKNNYNATFTQDILFLYNQERLIKEYFVEIGFYAYFMLRKLKRSLRYEKDEFYQKAIICLMPEQVKEKIQKIRLFAQIRIFFKGYFFFAIDFMKFVYKKCKKIIIKQKIPKKVFETNESIKQTLQVLEHNSGKIEIVLEGGSLQQVHFIKMPYCNFKSEDQKEPFLRRVDRTNPQTKVEGLMSAHHQFIRQFKYDHNIKKVPFLSLFSKYRETWEISAFILSFVINFLILSSFYQVYDQNGVLFQQEVLFGRLTDTQTVGLIQFFGVLILFNTIVICMLELFGKIPIYFTMAFNPNKFKHQTSLIFSEINPKSHAIVKVYKSLVNSLQLICTDYLLFYNLICLIFTILGVRVHHLYFTFHLSYIIITSATLFNVLKSIIEPGFRLLLTIIFFLIVEYIFVVIAFTYYSQDYPGTNCDNLVRCFIVTIDQTFKSGGAVGGFLSHAYEQNGDTDLSTNWVDYSRIAFDNIFNFLINILIIQMIAGIIIDKFGALREEDDLIQKDSATVCFICGRSKETIDKVYEGQGGFERHIAFEHNMWNYVFYCAYLYQKQELGMEDFTNREQYLLSKIQSFDNTWMPAYYPYKD